MKFRIVLLNFILLDCIAGGFTDKGGYVDNVHLYSSATNFSSKEFSVICFDSKKYEEDSNNLEKDIIKYIQYIPYNQYKGGCEQIGETSEFYLFHLFPASGKIDPEYAMTIPVQKLEGDTMINIRSWHETHYYSLLGKVRVFKVKGDVIKFAVLNKKDE